MGKPSYHGAARQTFGSGALRNPDDGTFNKIHSEKLDKIRERDHRERQDFDDVSSSSLGIVIKQAPVSPISHKPPGYNTRYVGRTPITPHHTGIHDPVFRPSGTSARKEDTWIHEGISHSRVNDFLGHNDVIMEEGTLMGSNHQSSGTPVECDATCGPMEFFCSKSCSCIHSDLHCGRIFMNFPKENRNQFIIFQMVKLTVGRMLRMKKIVKLLRT